MNATTQEITQSSITFLNMTGDVTITWDDENKEAITRLVEEKMAEGYTFFILKPRLGGLLPPKKVAVTKLKQLQKASSIVVPDSLVQSILPKLADPALERVVGAGKANVVQFPGNARSLETQGRAQTATDVVKNRTIAVKRIVGG